MVINKNNLNEISPEVIYIVYEEIFNEIYLSFTFLKITKEEFKSLVLNEIISSKKYFNNSNSYDNFIQNRVIKLLRNKVKSKLKDYNGQLELLNDYINSSCKNIKNCDGVFIVFNKIRAFCKSYDFDISADLMSDLINKNYQVKKMLNILFAKYSRSIKDGYINKIFTNEIIILAMELYCDINEIEVAIDTLDDNTKLETADEIRIYLSEISQFPILNKEEEIQLSQRILNGDLEAKKRLVECNLKLVISIAKHYLKTIEGTGLTFMDIIQEGNMGLTKAAEKFDYSKNTKFSTYASWWIKQSITRAITEKSRNIRIPDYLMDKILKYKNAVRDLEQELGRVPTIDEIAFITGYSNEEVYKLSQIKDDTLSLDEPVKKDEEDAEINTFIDFVLNDVYDLEEEYSKKELVDCIHKLLDSIDFTEKEIFVLQNRFGFTDNEPKTLETIGKKLNITRERVRQIEAAAFNKIYKNYDKLKELTVFLDYPDENMEKIEQIKQDVITDKFKKINKKVQVVQDSPKKIIVKSIYEYYQKYSNIKLDDRTLINNILSQDILEYGIVKEYKVPNNFKVVHKMPSVYDCDKLAELLNDETILSQFSGLKTYEVMMLLLRYGYVNEKAFSFVSIASFFELDYEKTKEIIKCALLRYSHVLSKLDEKVRRRTINIDD